MASFNKVIMIGTSLPIRSLSKHPTACPLRLSELLFPDALQEQVNSPNLIFLTLLLGVKPQSLLPASLPRVDPFWFPALFRLALGRTKTAQSASLTR